MSNEHEQGRGGEQPHEPQLTPEQQLEAMREEMQRISERVEFLETRNQALEDSNAQLRETLSGVADRLSQRDDEELQGMASELREASEGAVVAETEEEEALGAERRQRPARTEVHQTQPRTAETKRRRRIFGIGAVAVGAVVAAIALWPNGDNNKQESVSSVTPTAEQRAATKKAEAQAAARMNGNVDVTRTTEQAKANASAAGEGQDSKKVDHKTWREASTVNRAVMRMDSTPDTLKQNIRSIFDAAPKDVSHVKKMQNRLQSFDAANVSRYNVVEAAAFGVKGDYGNALANYNALKGQPANTPSNLSHAEMSKYVENFMTDKNTKFVESELNGFYANTGQHNSKNVFTQEQHFSGVRSIKAINTTTGQSVEWKVGGGSDGRDGLCINVEQKLNKVQTPASTPAPSAPPAQGGPENVVPPAGTPDKPEQDRITSKPVSDQPRKPQRPAQPRPVAPADKPKSPEKPQNPGGKDHTKSPVTGDANHPEEEKRPNIDNPGPAIQPIGAPAEDPYKPPQTVEPPAGVGPTPQNPATTTPATGQNNGSESGAPAEVPAP